MMGFAQTQLSLAERAMRNDTGVMVFSRKVDNRMLIALILNKQTGVLSVIDRYMHPVDSVKMAPGDYDDLVHHRLDAFGYYTRQKKYKIEFRISIINQLRFRGKVYPNGDAYNYVVNQEFPELKRTDSAHIVSNIQLLEHDNNADSTLLWLLKLDDPITLDGHQIYTKTDHYKPGDHFSRGDSLFFVNSDPFSHLHLAILTKKNPHMFYYNRDKQCVAWYTIKPELVDELSKQDVFSYYLEFLEISKQSIYKKINALYLEKRPTIHLVSNAKPLKERISEAEKQEDLIDRKLDYAIYPDFKSYATILQANFPNVSLSRDEVHWCNFLGITPVDNGGHSDGIAGDTRYELKDWRDNVVATISNRRYQGSTDGRTVDHYEPDVLTAQDYYAFGAPMPGRSYNAGTYRYGYNGKENDDELTGIGNLQDYGMREYDTQLGRFLSVDPISAKYPELTPYQFASNSPIANIDEDGLEAAPASANNTQLNAANSIVAQNYDPKHNRKDISQQLMNAVLQYARTEQGQAQMKTAGDLQDFNSLVTNVWMETSFSDAMGQKGGAYRRLISSGKTPTEKANIIRRRSAEMQADMQKLNLIAEGLSDFWLGAMGSSLPGNYSPRPSRKFKFGSVFTEENITNISTHLSQFGDNPENDIMIGRLKDINAGKMRPTKIDYNFVAHELREQQLMSHGMGYDQAHAQTLKEQNMNHPGYENKLYTPEAIKAGNEAELRKYK